MTIVVTRVRAGDDALAIACEAVDRAAFATPQLDAQAELARDFAWLYAAAEDGPPPVGYLLAWLVGGELEIHDVATVPTARRRGVGAALVGRVLADATAAHAEAAFLEVRAHNDAAIALYARCGFTSVGRRARYYADGEDALLLRADLCS